MVEEEGVTTGNNNGEEWETRAKEWLSTLPKDQALSMTQVETWVQSNLPDSFKTLSQSQLLRRFSSLHASLHSQPQEVKQANRGENPARFQRTDQWRPVYDWLESLDLDEVLKSKDISDWLAANPEVYDQLCSRHSRYHLMHYIKKCHVKILKKRKKPNGATPGKAEHRDDPKLSVTIPYDPLSNVPKDSDLYRAKREEALHKFEILVELEKQLSTIVPKGKAAENSKEH